MEGASINPTKLDNKKFGARSGLVDEPGLNPNSVRPVLILETFFIVRSLLTIQYHWMYDTLCTKAVLQVIRGLQPTGTRFS